MTLMDKEIEWDFSATSHGKGDIDGLGGTCKRRVREKTKARVIDPQTSLEFAQCASQICSKINVLHCPKEAIENAKSSLDKLWNINNVTISSIPDTRKTHYFKKVSPYIIGVQTVTSDDSDYKEFSFLTGKYIPSDAQPQPIEYHPVEPQPFTYRQGEWIRVLYDKEPHTGLVFYVNHDKKLARVKCLIRHDGDWWKLGSERNAVWYKEHDVLGRPEQDPQMDRRGGLYKL